MQAVMVYTPRSKQTNAVLHGVRITPTRRVRSRRGGYVYAAPLILTPDRYSAWSQPKS